jgi:hypothetical protein
MAQAIEALATYQPQWLRSIALPHWYTRYTVQAPAALELCSEANWAAWTAATETDVAYLLRMLAEDGMTELAQLPEIGRLRRPSQQAAGVRGRMAGRVDCAACALGGEHWQG